MTKIHFRSYIHKKMILFPQRIDKDIAEDDPVRLLDALVDNLMLDNVYKLYKPSGRKPYHPQMMLKVILYAYMNNIYSCRRIESLLKRDIHFIFLAGYEQPDFITINRFRNRVKKEKALPSGMIRKHGGESGIFPARQALTRLLTWYGKCHVLHRGF